MCLPQACVNGSSIRNGGSDATRTLNRSLPLWRWPWCNPLLLSALLHLQILARVVLGGFLDPWATPALGELRVRYGEQLVADHLKRLLLLSSEANHVDLH